MKKISDQITKGFEMIAEVFEKNVEMAEKAKEIALNTPEDLLDLGFHCSPIGMEIPESATLEQWAKAGQKLTQSYHHTKWWLGDWAAFGERKYGQLKEFAAANGIDPHTLSNMARVSRKVEMSRRRDDLEWSYHEAVCGLPPKEQVKWLAKAKDDGLRRGDLRKAIRISRGDKCALESEGPSLELGTKHYDDLAHWLKERPKDFWTERRSAIWKERIRELAELIPS